MRLLLCAALVGACHHAPPPVAAAPGATITGEVVFLGMCDASGAVALSSTLLIVADDEDNVLRIYDADAGGAPRAGTDVSAALDVPIKGKKHPRPAEVDLEAATRLGDHAFWVSSHGRNSKGKLREERLHLFATTLAEEPEVLGDYDGLLRDLLADARYDAFDLAHAATLAPKAPGGLNIEGLTATPEGALLIGFRNPIPERRALIVTLLDPEGLVDGAEAARFGEPRLIDLGGQGIRSLSWWRGRYLILAGDPAAGGVTRLYTWDGEAAPVRIDVDLSAYNPEGFFSPEERDEILLLSDDGSVLVDGVPCKELDDGRSFRGVRVRL